MSKRHELPYHHRRSRTTENNSFSIFPYRSVLFFLASLTFCFYQTLCKPPRTSHVLKSNPNFFSGSGTVHPVNAARNHDYQVHNIPLTTSINERPWNEIGQNSVMSNQLTTLQTSSGQQNENPKPLNTMKTSPTNSESTDTQMIVVGTSPPSIPMGPLPLPILGHGAHASSVAGASWTAAATKGLMSHLPAFLKVKAMSPSLADAKELESESIFSARRKGRWMGCTSKWHLVCKGVYKAIKKTGAIKVMDTNCAKNTEWLPLVIRKLREDLRTVSLRCADPQEAATPEARQAYAPLKHVTWSPFDVFEDTYTNKTDLLLAYDFLRHQSLIRAVRLFRRAKDSGLVQYITFDNTPGITNSPSAKTTSLINVLVEPFMFPNAFALYDEPLEQSNPSVPQQIMTMKLEDLFTHSFTPQMIDLMDPRKRRRMIKKPN